MRVQVSYTVPVEVMLELEDDLSGGTISRVVVIDEEARPASDPNASLPEVHDGRVIHDADYNDVTNQLVRQLALEITENPRAMWPAWEFGF